MAVKKKPVTFETSDGEEFDSKEKAETHESVKAAEMQLVEARRALLSALAENALTADGHEFDFSHTYHFIREMFSWPDVVQIRLYRTYDNRFGVETRDGEDRLIVIDEVTNDRDGTVRFIHYPVCELYWSERKAKEALLKAHENRIAEKQEDAEKLRQELAVKSR